MLIGLGIGCDYIITGWTGLLIMSRKFFPLYEHVSIQLYNYSEVGSSQSFSKIN